ncbi:MAG: arginine ABC transporter substrate-binding protein, partial [Rodentibacter sp.]
MKKRLLAAILIGVSAISAAEELTFGTEPSYPPFEST